MQNQQAFTLIELLVVVLIIGILAAVAVPQYQAAVDKSRIKAMLPVMRHIANAEEVYKLANGNYTLDFRELDVDLPTSWMSNTGYIVSTPDGRQYTLSLDGYVLAFPFGLEAGKPYIYRAFNADSWLCYPVGTTRGVQLCKSLGCKNPTINTFYCSFQP